MDQTELIRLAREAGFSAAVLPASQVPVDGKFRAFCEENRCGQYHANYSCPPLCGSVEQMHSRILGSELALVLETQWPIDGYQDTQAIRHGKQAHNREMLRLNEALCADGWVGICAGGSCCDLCEPCALTRGDACVHPKVQFSCLSAYCVDVAELAKRCGLEFAWDQKRLFVYSMILLRRPGSKG